jgi:hypothetical protein
VRPFVPTGPILRGIDETLERRRGAKIAAKGVYRDAPRSSKRCMTQGRSLRWMVMMLLVPIPWAARVGALPFFSVLAPSERDHQQRGRARRGSGSPPRSRCATTPKPAVWYHTGKPVVRLRWMLIRDPWKQFEARGMGSAQHRASPQADDLVGKLDQMEVDLRSS